MECITHDKEEGGEGRIYNRSTLTAAKYPREQRWGSRYIILMFPFECVISQTTKNRQHCPGNLTCG